MIGDFFEPLDWAPDEGHGTDPHLHRRPVDRAVRSSRACVPAGESVRGRRDPGRARRAARVTTRARSSLISDAPKQPALEVDVTLAVGRPDRTGARPAAPSWTRTTFEPFAGAEITVHTTWDGGPLELTDTADADGHWSVIGPAGTWDADVSSDGFLPETGEVTIVADGTLEGQDVFLHADQPHGTIRPRSLRFTLLRGRQDEQRPAAGEPRGAPGPHVLGRRGRDPAAERRRRRWRGAARAACRSRRPRTRTRRIRGAPGHASPGHAGTAFEGDVIAQWDTGMSLPWGVGYRNGPDTVTLSDPEDLIDVEFTTDGERIERVRHAVGRRLGRRTSPGTPAAGSSGT